MYDINDGTGFPLAAHEYAAQGSHLPGQPVGGGLIQHWLAPTGYSSSGGVTVYEDSGWGKGSAVQASTSLYVTALGGRGYVY